MPKVKLRLRKLGTLCVFGRIQYNMLSAMDGMEQSKACDKGRNESDEIYRQMEYYVIENRA
jgi:hypothetical protein